MFLLTTALLANVVLRLFPWWPATWIAGQLTEGAEAHIDTLVRASQTAYRANMAT